MDITIAILPFNNSNVVDNNLLIEGFMDDLIINLSKFIGLSVISSQTIRSLQGNTTDYELETDYFVKGSFRDIGSNLRLTIQLVRKQDYRIIYAEDYDFSFEEFFKVQDLIIKQVVNIIQQQVDHDLLSLSYKQETTELKAYEHYLRGMSFLKKGGTANDTQARSYFEKAIEQDGNFARAYTGLSLVYFNEWSCQMMEQWETSKSGAQEYALKALEINEHDYIALMVAGRTFLFSREFEKAEHYIRKSLKMNPNDASNLLQIVFCLMFLGYAEESVELFEKARRLNPLHPESYYAYGSNIYFEAGDYQYALELGEKVNLQTCFVDFPAYMAATCFHLGAYDKMREYWQIYLQKYSKDILRTDALNEQEALQWQINVNPYKDHTNLRAFWNFIADEKHIDLETDTQQVSRNTANTFRKNGHNWEVRYMGEPVLIPDLKGLQDIATLLQRPEETIHCSELMGEVAATQKGFEVIDQKAKTSYKNRILQLQQDLAQAETAGNYKELAELQEEYDAILDHLSKTSGLNGKNRKTSSTVDKVRSAVTWRIRNAIKRIEQMHPQLGKHLSLSIKTGTFCSYQPEYNTEWRF